MPNANGFNRNQPRWPRLTPMGLGGEWRPDLTPDAELLFLGSISQLDSSPNLRRDANVKAMVKTVNSELSRLARRNGAAVNRNLTAGVIRTHLVRPLRENPPANSRARAVTGVVTARIDNAAEDPTGQVAQTFNQTGNELARDQGLNIPRIGSDGQARTSSGDEVYSGQALMPGDILHRPRADGSPDPRSELRFTGDRTRTGRLRFATGGGSMTTRSGRWSNAFQSYAPNSPTLRGMRIRRVAQAQPEPSSTGQTGLSTGDHSDLEGLTTARLRQIAQNPGAAGPRRAAASALLAERGEASTPEPDHLFNDNRVRNPLRTTNGNARNIQAMGRDKLARSIARFAAWAGNGGRDDEVEAKLWSKATSDFSDDLTISRNLRALANITGGNPTGRQYILDEVNFGHTPDSRQMTRYLDQIPEGRSLTVRSGAVDDDVTISWTRDSGTNSGRIYTVTAPDGSTTTTESTEIAASIVFDPFEMGVTDDPTAEATDAANTPPVLRSITFTTSTGNLRMPRNSIAASIENHVRLDERSMEFRNNDTQATTQVSRISSGRGRIPVYLVNRNGTTRRVAQSDSAANLVMLSDELFSREASVADRLNSAGVGESIHVGSPEPGTSESYITVTGTTDFRRRYDIVREIDNQTYTYPANSVVSAVQGVGLSDGAFRLLADETDDSSTADAPDPTEEAGAPLNLENVGNVPTTLDHVRAAEAIVSMVDQQAPGGSGLSVESPPSGNYARIVTPDGRNIAYVNASVGREGRISMRVGSDTTVANIGPAVRGSRSYADGSHRSLAVLHRGSDEDRARAARAILLASRQSGSRIAPRTRPDPATRQRARSVPGEPILTVDGRPPTRREVNAGLDDGGVQLLGVAASSPTADIPMPNQDLGIEGRAFGVEIELRGPRQGEDWRQEATDALRAGGFPTGPPAGYGRGWYDDTADGRHHHNRLAIGSTYDTTAPGAEVVLPALLGTNGQAYLRRAAEVLRAAGARPGRQTTHGTHVHVDIRDFDRDKKRKIGDSYENNSRIIDELVAPARRSQHFAGGRYREVSYVGDHGSAVAFTNKGTVELRRLGSNLDPEELEAWSLMWRLMVQRIADGEDALPAMGNLAQMLDAIGMPEAQKNALLARAARVASSRRTR